VIAIKALVIKSGDEVITTAFSWIATSAAITMAGGKVVFCDIEKDGFNIDPEQIRKKITKKTVGIIPVHLYGIPADMEKIMKIAKQNNLWVIEDCAQAHLADIKGKKVGNFGSFGTFSFFPGKNLGALGDAGCLVTNNKKLAIKARLIANHGGKGRHLLEGVNSRLDTIQASFLNIKIKYAKTEALKRINNSKIYFDELKNNKKILLPIISNLNFNVFHQYVIRSKKRNLLKKYLLKKNIETQIHYKKILPLLPAYKKKNKKKFFRNALKASNEVLCLPISTEIDSKNIKSITNSINKFNIK
jgi:dTDP-4-amino-4,6-dideoxygalactose transaminase